MAQAKKPRKETFTPEETALKAKMDALSGVIEKQKDKVATPDQAKQMKGFRADMGKLRFVRIANKRVPKALTAINGIGNLSGAGYVKTEAQVTAICKALRDAVDQVETSLSGKTEKVSGFTLPTT